MARKSQAGDRALLAGEEWGRIWPPLAEHLYRVLRRRVPSGLDPAELVQETAFRMLRSAKTFANADHVAKEATTIALNLATDARRRSRLVISCPMPHNITSSDDVEAQVVLSEQWASLRRHAAMKSVDLYALVDPSSDPDSRTEAAKSRRYRARKLLRDWREAAGAALALPRLRWLIGGAAAAATFAASPLMPFGPALEPDRPSAETVKQARHLPAAALGHVALLEPALRGSPPSVASIETAASGRQGPTYRSQIELRGPGGTSVEKGTREYPPDAQPKPLACVRQEGPVSEFCVPHPLRP